jgi:hypothetical protein
MFYSSRCFGYVCPCCPSFSPPAGWCRLFREVDV